MEGKRKSKSEATIQTIGTLLMELDYISCFTPDCPLSLSLSLSLLLSY